MNKFLLSLAVMSFIPLQTHSALANKDTTVHINFNRSSVGKLDYILIGQSRVVPQDYPYHLERLKSQPMSMDQIISPIPVLLQTT